MLEPYIIIKNNKLKGKKMENYLYSQNIAIYNELNTNYNQKEISPVKQNPYKINSFSSKLKIPLNKDSISFTGKNLSKKDPDDEGANKIWCALFELSRLIHGRPFTNLYDEDKQTQLPQKIDFTPAKNIDEAIKFGTETFGIKYKNVKHSDLDIINWINEGLVVASNASFGKIHMPKNIIINNGPNPGSISYSGDMIFSRKKLNEHKLYLKKILEQVPDCMPEEIKKYTADIKTVQFLINGIENKANAEVDTVRTTFSIVHHELGHYQHRKNIGDDLSYSMGRPNDRVCHAEGSKEMIKLFNNSKEIAAQVSDYAQVSPLEFVAETYAGILGGIEYPQEVIDLYIELKGVLPSD